MSVSNIQEALEQIGRETKASDLKIACSELSQLLGASSISLQDVVKKLSEFILNIDNATLFKQYLSNILLALVSAKIPLQQIFSHVNNDICGDTEKLCHLEFSVVLAVLSDHPDVLQYALKYFDINKVPPFEVFIHHEDSYNVTPKKRRLLSYRHKITDKQIVQCCHKLLSKLPNEFSTKWDWTKFFTNFSSNSNPEIRCMVKECMAILTNMTEAQSKILAQNLDISDQDFLTRLTSEKEQPVFTMKEIIKDNNINKESVVNIDGILLPLYDKTNVQDGNLVPVKSTVNNLRSLALAVASGQALSLMGPVGSGKTSLVEHLAAITGRKGVAFKKVQLGDQTDSRMLLGGHQCTDVPGEFVWRPGVLTEAVQNGHWLLLEDIDCAALDVASTLSSLLERNTLCVPGYRDSLPVTPGFQLFVTQRTLTTNYGFQKKMSNSSTLLQKHLTQINVEPLSRSELSEIIQTLYPSLSTICPRMLEVFMMFSVGSHDTSLQSTETTEKDTSINIIRGSRLISTRDLLKWCSRSVVGFNVSSPESALKVLQDALDIFTCSVASPHHRLELAKKVGTCLGVVETKSEFYCKNYKPNVSLTPKALEVGRAKVPRVEKTLESIDFDNKQVVFSFTKQSACLLERIACCVTSNEPVLLVGETGTGKTSSVQYLARQTGHKLVVINMNQQSDSADLLGGYKPVDLKYVVKPIRHEFEELFKCFYNVEKNKKFLGHIETCYSTENWNALLTLMKQSHKAALNRLTVEKKDKKLRQWLAFGHKLEKLEQQVKSASRLTFAFIEGSLVKAMQEGHWVLLDEINLASAEILECLAGLLEDKSESIDLLEKGDKVPIKRHPDFTLFACMNPATDVGKKDLPVGLRNRFTEFFIDELTERNDLMLLIGDYLYHMNLGGAILEAIFTFYSNIRKEAKLSLVDGSGNTPHYSLRTLCRALTAAAKAKCGTVARSLYEAFCLSFLTQLDSSSHPIVEAMIAKAVIGKRNIKSVLNQLIPEPQALGQNYLLFEGHWIPQGKLDINIPEGYILTPTVRKNLRDIARIISLGRLPVLLQGDTSVGKTSLITYIAKASGNYCVRINNHEHTDLQEYIGSYATDSSGKLIFKEGVLVEAMRKGYWIILDELNLAPSDVLEALNRVLDDNRELFIPETQQVVKADPNFMLFATQNPPGLYGGRKMLSRAFRNRFVELHFDEIPKNELETILHQRCHVPPAYSKKMINVMADLQIRRRGSAAVQGKDGFITLRDLFRWGQRYKHASKEALTDEKFYDWDQHIADEGYLILAGKVRQTDERSIIEEVIEKHIKRKVIPENLFSLHQTTSPVTKHILEAILNNQLAEFAHVVWTYNMRRLAVLIAKAFSINEPVLLVGETGCGKTTICQVLAALKQRQLLAVNCHMHTESSDFLGGLRPVRQYKNDGKLFEWVDGPLIKAMESGDMFLADEISLADDSVLERLNSLLEPERQLVLAERGMDNNSDIVVITADSNFHFIGTMNPGGDFGKKELSPALRNRFTEIWCDSVSSREDLLKVLEKSVSKGISLGNQEDGSSGIGTSILDFTEWLKNSEVTNKFPFSIRDLLSWVQFINTTVTKGILDTPEAYVHGACMTFLDCFGTALTGHISAETLTVLRMNAINFLLEQIKTVGNEYTEKLREMLTTKKSFSADCDDTKFGIENFYVDIRPSQNISEEVEQRFTFTAPTTGSNTLRLLRGMQLNKAILLEGNPGVGKTSLVTALAKSSGHKVVRINLSDQTDITDLFGTDLPTEDGTFTFKEGAFLNALQNGDWILLDELNLAPQPVLEGLNACLDHRGEVYIPELGKTFKVKQQTKLFACQNPLKQGGARRGLPVSFLNRFTQVYIDVLTKEDLIYIVESQFPSIPKDILHRIVNFNCKIAHEITEIQSWAHRGAPWEMNLRDIQRWCEALLQDQYEGEKLSPGKFVDMLYVNRMRTAEDKDRMIRTYNEFFNPDYPRSNSSPLFDITDDYIIIGDVYLERHPQKEFKNRRSVETNQLILRNQLPTLKSLAQNVKMNWLSILVGPTATGKSSIVQVLADLTGNELQVVPVTSAMDVSDLLGGFEQVDYNRNLENLYDQIETLTIQTVRNIWVSKKQKELQNNTLLSRLYQYKNMMTGDSNNILKFNEKIQYLTDHCENLVNFNEPFSPIATKILETQISLKRLSMRVSKATCVNAGGKFEWIDSLLVKTMIEGSWLLLDNVNLTSAAVLDRLNGLLEPNGVLSVPERGDMSEISPHPNFRVFFTMDPKYGEISRAMRNRGVEIFLLRPDDWNLNLSETLSRMDLKALLSSCGLPCQYHVLCIKLHELMTSFVQGLERPTISHLLQAAHLTWQQVVRGIAQTTALINSFADVYIKPRCGADFTNPNMSLAEMKNEMLKILEKEVEEFNYSEGDITNTTHTLSVKGLCTNSQFEIAKQIAFIATQESCNIDPECNNFLHTCLSVFNAYAKCPTHLQHLCYGIIKKTLKDQRKTRLNSFAEELNENVFSYIKRLNYDMACYKRFYPEYHILEDEDNRAANTELTLLFTELQKLMTNSVTQKDVFSVLDYSKAVLSGNLTDDFVEYPILKYCQKYLETIDRCLTWAIKEARNSFDDKTCCRIIQLMNWRSRFVVLASRAIFVTTGTRKRQHLREEIVPLLYVHSKWLHKNLIREIFKLLPRQHHLIKGFESTIGEITDQSEKDSSEITKLSKKVRKLFGQPKLYENKEEYSLCVRRTNIYKKICINLNGPVSKQLEKLSVTGAAVTDQSLALDVPDENKLTILEENLEKIERNATLPSSVLSELKLLPCTSYIFQRVLCMLQINLIELLSQLPSDCATSGVNIELKDVLDNLIALSKVSRGFSPGLLNLLNLIQKILEGGHDGERISSFPAKFWDEFYKTLVEAPAFHPLPFLSLRCNSDATNDDVPANTKRFSSNLPLMPYYVQKLTVSTENQDTHLQLAYETVSLEDCDNYSKQLQQILNILWRNIATLDSSATLKIKSNATFEAKKFEQFVSYLHSIMTQSKKAVPTVNTWIGDTINLLRTYLLENNTFLDTLDDAHKVYKELTNYSSSQHFDDLRTKILTVELSILTSILFVKTMSEVNPIDHVERYRLKVQYIEEDVQMFDALLSTYYFHGLISGTINDNRTIDKPSQITKEFYSSEEARDSLKTVHPHCGIIMELRTTTADKIRKYALCNTFRPEEPSYNSFAKDCKHFTKSVLSTKTTNEITRNVVNICNKLYDYLNSNQDGSLESAALTVLKETSSWLYSINAFYKNIEGTYSEAFPDLAKPLQSSLSQIIHSFTSAIDLIKEALAKKVNGPFLTRTIKCLMMYPSSIQDNESVNIDEDVSQTEICDKLTKIYILDSCDDKFIAESNIIEFLKTDLIEVKMQCTAKESVDKRRFNYVLSVLNELFKYWEQQQRDIEKKKEDDEALYVTKSKCEDEDEEAVAQEEIQEMFPSYSDQDFSEFKPPTLEQKPLAKPQSTDKNKTRLLISSDDISSVYKWHSDFVRNMTSAEWLSRKKKLVGNDVVSAFVKRYPTFSRIIEKRWEALEAELEGTLSPSLLVLVSQIKNKVDGVDSLSGKVDFYKSPWVSETRQCVPLLLKVKETTNEMLEQWPDFPTLKEIIVIVNRILGFPVTSPVSRFLTGLELLRDKIEEWNKNAHKGNNMIDISLAVGQQIINWRKLEMANWKECLNNVYQRQQSEAHKYWFFLYSVINMYLVEGKDGTTVPVERVIGVLMDFMEKSDLAQYEVRLDIIYAYHCHLVHLEANPRRDELLSVLWNIHNYYSQFSIQVATYIKEKRAPIEKKLKDFVKICTWDRDLSYWSVKDTVEKAHKALHKNTKEFEKVLKEVVTPCLVDRSTEVSGEHVGIWDRPKRATATALAAGGAYMIDPLNHVLQARNIKKYLDEAEQPSKVIPENSLLSKVTNLLNKAKSLCKDTMTNTGYPTLVQALDDFVKLVIETNNHLGSLEVDASLPKDKQKSQGKNIVQQKRKSLADLFKYLTKMGLNYRTGLVILSAAEKDLYDFTIPPVDLDAAMSYLKSRRCDASLSLLWSGCETYFQKNIARHRVLSAALLTPHQDLGFPNIERCKGFAAQLLQLTNTQKKSISKYSRRLFDLRTLTTNLTNALEIHSTEADISTLNKKLELLTECYAKTSIALEQFTVLLKSCPENELCADFVPDFDSVLSDSKVVRCYKNSEEWKDLHKKVSAIISAVNKQKSGLIKLANVTPKRLGQNKDVPIISQSHIDVAEEAKLNIKIVIEKLVDLVNEYEFKFKTLTTDFESKHPVLRSIVELSQYLESSIVKIEKLGENTGMPMESPSNNDLVNQTEDLIAIMLLIIQSIYKKHLPQENENIEVINAIDEIIHNGDKPPEEPKDILEDKHLKELLQEKLTSDSRMLQLDILINKMGSLLTNYVQYIESKGKDVEEMRSVVMRLVPILEQTVLFVQYFITQNVAVHRISCKMLSILLKIFSDLAMKGFCKPSDLDMEDGDGEDGPGKLSSGTGLGEGEGQKDISDQIENQDQLDDAKRPGDEKKEDDKDCKEEDKGVNMTDDFDSHLQDVEKKDGENSDQEDEDDADKQMGDTDNAAEKLDQQIWGSEDEEESNENDKKDKDEKGKGEKTGEKHMAAKEEEQGTDDGEQGKDDKQKKDINEMEEPEVDDDHVDPYHGNHPQLPEPEDFELPENMDIDDDGEGEKEEEGETETENPFEIDIMPNLPEEPEAEKDKEENRNGLDVSSDEEDGEDDGNKEGGDLENKEEEQLESKTDEEKPTEYNENPDEPEQDTNPEDVQADNAEENLEPENNENNDELPKNSEDIDKEDEIEEKSHEANPQANPSSNDPSAQDRAENAQMERGTNDNVETNDEQTKDENAEPNEQAQEQVGEEKQSSGRADLDKSSRGHRGEKQAARRADSARDSRRQQNKPADTDHMRTLGDINEEKRKQSHTLNVERDDEAEDGGGDENDEEKDADAFQHVKQAKENDLQAIDAATKEQADQQPVLQQEEEEAEQLKDDDEIPMDVDDDDIQVEKSEELRPDKLKDGAEKDKEKSGNKKDGNEEPTGESGVEVEGEKILTENVPRGVETSYHTKIDDTPAQIEDMTVEDYMSIREWLITKPTGTGVSTAVWRTLWTREAGAARALCERLRLVLEPTMCSRRAGDFRTGRAINMRRVIPYIASHFRKDRIWLRRRKPARREYSIAIAVDDSHSMADNSSKELAFESLALVSQALNLLESGDLAVLSFGEKPNLLHPFTEQFSEHSGSKILEQLQFEQTKTKIAQLLDFCCVMFEERTIRSDAPNAKLLVIVGDGRNIFAEGEKTVIQAVRRARQQGIFLVYVIIDNPENRDSIMDIRKPVMDTVTNKLGFISYLDAFPFPFYLILRDMNALPNVLGDALRQWFELAANTS